MMRDEHEINDSGDAPIGGTQPVGLGLFNLNSNLII